MSAFASYYTDFLWLLVQNVWAFIKGIALSIYNFFITDIGEYFTQLGSNIGSFNVLGWICLIFVVIVNTTLVFFLCYRLVQLIRRYIIYRGKNVEKDKLEEEVARLREQADQLVEEKSQIFALKITNGIAGPSGKARSDGGMLTDGASGEEEQKPAGAQRFTKLIDLDEKYTANPVHIFMGEADMLPLPAIITRFVNFAASQLHLYYTEETVRIFFAGMATSKVIILEGISGTGKTSLPYAMGKFFNTNTSIISVQPSWRDRAELIGYFNEFTKKFNETDFLANLYEATLREDPNFIVLDEMNLARIEYYFADFLSIMEMPDVAEWKIDLIASPQSNDPMNVHYGKLLVPQNVWFIGTANNDDSTFTITDKVYDRAVSIALNNRADYFDAPLTESYNCSYDYLESLFIKAAAANKLSDQSTALIMELDGFIREKFKISFGNRIMKQIKLFVPAYMACGGDELSGIDYMITTKILRKFNSLNLPFLTRELNELYAFFDKKFGKGVMKYSQAYIRDLQKMG
ncbi:MAG: hypothetical protein LUI60_03565 [Clostridia bacterium]|nr:hypothetical protein [Clostridia bacterium]